MVPQATANGYLETMETDKDQICQPDKTRHEKTESVEWSNTRKSYWHTAGAFILSTTITNERLQQAGYVFFTDYYRSLKVVN
ncbi:hypothetical protein MASR1M74_31900 [Lentimicrobium sp.]